MLLGVSERKVIVAVVARIEIEDLDAVEQLGGRRGALVAEGMRLNAMPVFFNISNSFFLPVLTITCL